MGNKTFLLKIIISIGKNCLNKKNYTEHKYSVSSKVRSKTNRSAHEPCSKVKNKESYTSTTLIVKLKWISKLLEKRNPFPYSFKELPDRNHQKRENFFTNVYESMIFTFKTEFMAYLPTLWTFWTWYSKKYNNCGHQIVKQIQKRS